MHGLHGNQNYLILFDQIDKLAQESEEYNENKIKYLFRDRVFIKHLSSEKNYLHTQILKSLTRYYTTRSPEMELDELIHSASLLYKKGLYQQSLDKLNKAIKFALQNEYYSKVFKIVELKVLLIPQTCFSAKRMQEDYEKAFLNVQKASKIIETQTIYRQLHSKFYYLMRKYGDSIRSSNELNRFEATMSHPLLMDESQAKSRESRSLFFFIKVVYNIMIRDYPKAFELARKEFREIEAIPKVTEKFPFEYMTGISNLCEIALRMGNLPLCKRYLTVLRKINPNSSLLKAKLFYRYYDLSLRINILSGDFENVNMLSKSIESVLKKYKSNIHKSRELSIYYHMAYIYFGLEDYKNALLWINKILQDKTDLRQDLLCYGRILNCLIHYEHQNYTIFFHLLKSTKYFISKHKRMYATEVIFLASYGKLIQNPIFGKQKSFFIDLKNKLEQIHADPNEQAAIEYLNFYSWIKSKINRTPFYKNMK